MSETKVKFMNQWFKKVSAKMYDYNCDVKLIVGSETFKAHRAVLEQASDYFSAMFTHNMQEKENNVIELKEISPEGFSAMIEYFYHGYVTIDVPNIVGVIEAARFFHIDWLIGICSYYLIRHLSLEDFNLVLQLADQYVLGDLRRQMFEYFCECFTHMAARSHSMFLQFDVIQEIVAGDRYIEASEGAVLKWILRWLAHDTARDQFRADLLRHIRYPLLSRNELASLGDDIIDDLELSPLIEEARHYHIVPSRQCLISSPRTEPRGSREFILMYSGIEDDNQIHYKSATAAAAGTAGFLIEKIDTQFLDIVFEFAAVATLGNFVFVVGGYQRDNWCSSDRVYLYDATRHAWVQLTSLLSPRVSHALCPSKRGLYAVAGIDHVVLDGMDRELILDTIEFYDPEINQWKFIRSFPFGCYNTGSLVVDEKLYVSGGISGDVEHNVPIDFFHVYDPSSEEWTSLPSMFVGRHGHAIISIDSNIYVFGGHAAGEDTMGFIDCQQNEVFNIDTCQWTILTDTPTSLGHIYSGLVNLGDTVYVLGGSSSEVALHKFDRDKEIIQEEGEPVGSFVHKMIKLRVAMSALYLDELQAANTG